MWLDIAGDRLVPESPLVEELLDVLEIRGLLFAREVLEVPGLLEDVDLAALLKIVRLLLNVFEVKRQMIVNILLELTVSVGILDNVREARRCVSNETIDELLEVRVQVDGLNVLNRGLHVNLELLEALLESGLVRHESHTIGLLELDLGYDCVLLLVIVHLVEDVLCGVLVDAHLSFHDSIIDEPDEDTETLVIITRQVENLVFQGFLLLLQHDRLLLLSLSLLRVLKVLLLAE